MLSSEVSPPSVEVFAQLINNCCQGRNLAHALHVQTLLCRRGLDSNVLLGNKLVRLFVESRGLRYAEQSFYKLGRRDETSWNWIITGHAEDGDSLHALNLYRKMAEENARLQLSRYTFLSLLRACKYLKDVQISFSLHAEICRKGLLADDLFLASALIEIYARCGCHAKAREVFDKLQSRDVVLWTVLIAGYVEHGDNDDALMCLEAMQDEGISPDAFTYVCSLRACSSSNSTDKSQEMHAQVVTKGMEDELILANTLVDTYVKLGLLTAAKQVFDKILVRSVVSWNILIGGYLDSNLGEKAMNCYEQMQNDGVPGDEITFVCALKACAAIESLHNAQEIHMEIARKGFDEASLVGNTLVDFYAKCGLLGAAQQVFDKLPNRDSVSWSALLSGLINSGHGEDALFYFQMLQVDGIYLNSVTFTCILKACICAGATIEGQEIHSSIMIKGLESDILICNTLVDMYSKLGWLATAQKVFDGVATPDVVTWNALIAGYVEQERGDQVIGCTQQMHNEGISADDFTVDCCLKACGSLGASDEGHKLHVQIICKGFDKESSICTTLVDMYAKCGCLAEAQEMFDRLPDTDIVSWTTLLTGYSQLGETEIVFNMFHKITSEGIMPNLITFLSVLNACSHAGLVYKAEAFFESMIGTYGFIPTQEHYTCMVDVFGRAGLIDKAIAMMKKIPLHPGIIAWHSVLGACRKWGNLQHGRDAFEQAVWLDGKVGATYVCMSNIYADSFVLKECKNVYITSCM